MFPLCILAVIHILLFVQCSCMWLFIFAGDVLYVDAIVCISNFYFGKNAEQKLLLLVINFFVWHT